jgi:hypothetical protein
LLINVCAMVCVDTGRKSCVGFKENVVFDERAVCIVSNKRARWFSNLVRLQSPDPGKAVMI